jgi:hypothetical protein
MLTKRCFKCLADKPLAQFYKHSGMADGHLNKCKDCARADVAQHRTDNIEKVRAYDRERNTLRHNADRRRRIVDEYHERYPERHKATTAVSNAIRNGKLFPQPCWVCGKKAVAHHPDYDRPLDVVWLCQAHHKQAHALVQPGNSGKVRG